MNMHDAQKAILADLIAQRGTLPRCVHGNALMDWGGEMLYPSCGCKTKLHERLERAAVQEDAVREETA